MQSHYLTRVTYATVSCFRIASDSKLCDVPIEFEYMAEIRWQPLQPFVVALLSRFQAGTVKLGNLLI